MGLVFSIYENNGQTVGFQASPVLFQETTGGWKGTTVLNEYSTDNVGLDFNTSGADQVVFDIEGATGAAVERWLAENLYIRNMQSALKQGQKGIAPLNKPTNAVVVGNAVIVTGPNARAYITDSVTGARTSTGSNINTSSGQVTNIQNKKGVNSLEVDGVSRPVSVIEGRADLDAIATECDGNSQLTFEFDHYSPLEREVEIYREAESLGTFESPVTLTC